MLNFYYSLHVDLSGNRSALFKFLGVYHKFFILGMHYIAALYTPLYTLYTPLYTPVHHPGPLHGEDHDAPDGRHPRHHRHRPVDPSPEMPSVGSAVVEVEDEYRDLAHHQQPGQAEAHHEEVAGLHPQRGEPGGAVGVMEGRGPYLSQRKMTRPLRQMLSWLMRR